MFSGSTEGTSMRPLSTRPQIELCQAHASRNGCLDTDCNDLHICKFFFQGKVCKYGKKCRFGHDLETLHNKRCLATHQLEGADLATIRKFTNTLPWICTFYNKASGQCRHSEEGKGCTKLHVCLHYVKGDCKNEDQCKLSHNIFDPQPKALLENCGIDTSRDPQDILHDFRKALDQVERNPETTASCGANDSGADKKEGQIGICLYNLWNGGCLYKEKCWNFHLPRRFQWQYVELQGCQWTDFDEESNKEIEFNYADPHKNTCFSTLIRLPSLSPFKVDFDKMEVFWPQIQGSSKLRRLTTESSVITSTPSPQHTKWRWFWAKKHGHWVEYGQNGQDKEVNSDVLEMEYLKNSNGTFCFGADRRRYTIDFKMMTEKRNDQKKVRRIRRRPAINSETPQDIFDTVPAMILIPPYWNLYVPGCGRVYEMVKICKKGDTAHEFQTVKNRFAETMSPSECKLQSIERIQNITLWRDYLKIRYTIKERFGSNSTKPEMLLFHGGREDLLDAVCSQGPSGTPSDAFGSGIPCVRDANRSTPFRGNKLLLLRVSVGEFTSGKPGEVNMHEADTIRCCYACVVDNDGNPTEFLVSDKRQVYPAYVITYTWKKAQ